MPFTAGCSVHPGSRDSRRTRRLLRNFTATAASFLLAGTLPTRAESPSTPPAPASYEAPEAPKSVCELNSARGDIKHLIFIQFGHLHFTRDNPNVPSDLEQMPRLLQFLERNGMLLTNHHSVLPSDPASDAMAALTGLYPDRFGFTPSAGYWTTPPDASSAEIVSGQGQARASLEHKAAPAPWVTFTRAGCNVGAVAIPGMALENTGKDVLTIFGANSLEAAMSVDPHTIAQAAADLEGIAIHCAAGNPMCALGRPDELPDEPRGYEGFSALFGHKNVAPVIGAGGLLRDLNGQIIADSAGNIGFPGRPAISAAQALAYAAAMQEQGVPITYAYISGAQERGRADHPFGPGEAGYVAQLKADDDAFDKFFSRLAAAGINQNNTLFVVTANEGSHFAGAAPVPATCDGLSTPCTYPKLDDNAVSLSDLLAKANSKLASAPFDVSAGMAPVFYLKNSPAASEIARRLEAATAKLTVINPQTSNPDHLTLFLADPIELTVLHMLNRGGPRDLSFVLFGNPDYAFRATATSNAEKNHGLLWNHGGIAPDINTTFVAFAGPGINLKGSVSDVWSDHTDIRPTMLALLGLKDSYATQGRALAEVFQEWALPGGIRDSGPVFLQLAETYKKINAPIGELGLTSLRISTKALAGDEAKYANLERQLTVIVALRDDLAAAMAKLLNAAEFQGHPISEPEARQLVRSANDLLDYVKLVDANEW